MDGEGRCPLPLAVIGTPGYRHTIGIARVWHFINVHGFILCGVYFVAMLFATEQWKRLVPTSPTVILQAWNTWVHYATFHLPAEPNGFYGYNALQQIAYFTVVFIFGPLAILTGIAMSPAVVNHFTWYAKLFGGRQSARSIHFLTMLSFLAFLVVHITLVVMTGFARNMNHIVLGTDDQRQPGHDGSGSRASASSFFAGSPRTTSLVSAARAAARAESSSPIRCNCSRSTGSSRSKCIPSRTSRLTSGPTERFPCATIGSVLPRATSAISS